jgi:hypothetical protein
MVLCFSLFCFTFSGIISFNINSFDIHYQQQYGWCSCYGINCKQHTEDALIDPSPPGTQADDDDVQIVGVPPAIEERPQEKRKSNDGDGQRSKQKKQQKRPAIPNSQQKRPAMSKNQQKCPAMSKNQQKCPVISDANLEKQVNRVRDGSLQNVVDSTLQATQAPDFDGANKVIKEVTKYFTMPITCTKSSLWWEGFKLFVPVTHPTLYKEHVMCKECSNFCNNPDAGIVKVGVNQSTSNLRAHKRHCHLEEYETLSTCVNKTTKKSSEQEVLPTSIFNMPGFSAKLKVKDARLLYRTAAATLAIKEGIPFRTFSQPSLHCLCIPLNSKSKKMSD